MKVFLSSALLLWSSSFVVAAAADGTNPMECVSGTDLVDGKDYFPVKVQPEDSMLWTVDYYDTYKIVTNAAVKERYLLYQCGTTDDPSTLTAGMADPDFAAILPVPLSDVGLLYTTMVPFMELLGLRTSISSILGSSAPYVSSPCVQELLTEGQIVDVASDFTVAAGDATASNVSVAFVGAGDVDQVQNMIRISETSELTNMAVLEWIKFYSLFFNMEGTANTFYTQAKERQMCVESNAALVTSSTADEDLPTVLWASYSGYCGGWDVARDCPDNYYCEMASSCSSNLLWSNEGTFFNTEKCGDRNYMTTEEFVAFASTAEHWIYTSPGWETTMDLFSNELSSFTSVQAEQVFDYQGPGANAWFEQRLAEPDIILQDFCAVVGTDTAPSASIIPHKRQWFRNVFTEPIGSLGECTNVEAPLVTGGSPCSAIPDTLFDANKPGSNTTDTDSEPASSAFIMKMSVVVLSVVASMTLL